MFFNRIIVLLITSTIFISCSSSYEFLSNNSFFPEDEFSRHLLIEYKNKAQFEAEEMQKNISSRLKDESVMTSALDVLTTLSANKRIVLMAKGTLIPNAVAVANIVTENMLKGNSKIQDIKLDSVISEEDGQMISNIEIILIKN